MKAKKILKLLEGIGKVGEAKIHLNDKIHDEVTYDELVLVVGNESSAYNVRDDYKKLEKEVKRVYGEILKQERINADSTLKKNMDSVIRILQNQWNDK